MNVESFELSFVIDNIQQRTSGLIENVKNIANKAKKAEDSSKGFEEILRLLRNFEREVQEHARDRLSSVPEPVVICILKNFTNFLHNIEPP
jgi:hypothetical protein